MVDMDDIGDEEVLNLSNQKISKIPSPLIHNSRYRSTTKMHLDHNDIVSLSDLSSFPMVSHLTATYNKMHRMIQVHCLSNLEVLDLSHNNIRAIEGIRELSHLRVLNLSHNLIKLMDMALVSVPIEELILSNNLIENIPRINHLTKLKMLNLENNIIVSLPVDENMLPPSIVDLRLQGNKLRDLSELTSLRSLPLQSLTISKNPCLQELTVPLYRAYILNLFNQMAYCDNSPFSDLENASAEWLYSHGKGRTFRPGQHQQLVQYLNTNSPQILDVNKMKHILKKSAEIGAPFFPVLKPGSSSVMTKSLDPSIFQAPREVLPSAAHLSKSLYMASSSGEIEGNIDSPAPLPAASKLVPVPEALVSPMVPEIPSLPLNRKSDRDVVKNSQHDLGTSSQKIHSAEETVPTSKLQSIKTIAEVARARMTCERGLVNESDSRSRSSSEIIVGDDNEDEENYVKSSPSSLKPSSVPTKTASSEITENPVTNIEESIYSDLPLIEQTKESSEKYLKSPHRSKSSQPNKSPEKLQQSTSVNSDLSHHISTESSVVDHNVSESEFISEVKNIESLISSIKVNGLEADMEFKSLLENGNFSSQMMHFRQIAEQLGALENEIHATKESLWFTQKNVERTQKSARLQVNASSQLWNRTRDLNDEVDRQNNAMSNLIVDVRDIKNAVIVLSNKVDQIASKMNSMCRYSSCLPDGRSGGATEDTNGLGGRPSTLPVSSPLPTTHEASSLDGFEECGSSFPAQATIMADLHESNQCDK